MQQRRDMVSKGPHYLQPRGQLKLAVLSLTRYVLTRCLTVRDQCTTLKSILGHLNTAVFLRVGNNMIEISTKPFQLNDCKALLFDSSSCRKDGVRLIHSSDAIGMHLLLECACRHNSYRHTVCFKLLTYRTYSNAVVSLDQTEDAGVSGQLTWLFQSSGGERKVQATCATLRPTICSCRGARLRRGYRKGCS
jgi:hypothetical protein